MYINIYIYDWEDLVPVMPMEERRVKEEVYMYIYVYICTYIRIYMYECVYIVYICVCIDWEDLVPVMPMKERRVKEEVCMCLYVCLYMCMYTYSFPTASVRFRKVPHSNVGIICI
jgi:hypothetical protein